MPDASEERPITIGGLALDPQRWEASAEGRALHLTRTEFSLLMLMARNPGRAGTLAVVWHPRFDS